MSIFFFSRFPLVLGGIALLLLLLVGGGSLLLALGLHGSSHILAASLHQVPTPSCLVENIAANCTGKDPLVQGCVAHDTANTPFSADIKSNGRTIGTQQRRYSLTCHTWWGRLIDYRRGIHTETITLGDQNYTGKPQFVGPTYQIFYTPMLFDPNVAPQIVGSMQIDTQTVATATLPSVHLPTSHS